MKSYSTSISFDLQLSEILDCVLVYKQYLAKPDEIVKPLTQKDFTTIARTVLAELGNSWKLLDISDEVLLTRVVHKVEFDRVSFKIRLKDSA